MIRSHVELTPRPRGSVKWLAQKSRHDRPKSINIDIHDPVLTLGASNMDEIQSGEEDEEMFDILESPPERILRLIIKKNTIHGEIRHETLLNGGQLLGSRFAVTRFLRSDSHADVYVVREIFDTSREFDAHVFLDGDLPGNWSFFSKRKMKRLRKSCVAELKLSWRTVIVMDAQTSEPIAPFPVRSREEEYPSLPNQHHGKSDSQFALILELVRLSHTPLDLYAA